MEETNKNIESFKNMIDEKKDLINTIRDLILTDDDILKVSKDYYTRFTGGILVRDITSEEQINLRMTLLHIKSDADTDFSLHAHKTQSQMISVVKGKIMDLENNVTFSETQSFFVGKNKNHRLRYFAGSEVIVMYSPELQELKR